MYVTAETLLQAPAGGQVQTVGHAITISAARHDQRLK